MKQYVLAIAVAALVPSAGWAASQFDGSWTIAQTCPPTDGDVKGFSWTYAATVRNSVLSGVHSPKTAQDGSGRLSGKIGPDGTAILKASGQTGRSEYVYHHVAPGFLYHYQVQARFDPTNGSGTRIEQRPCDFIFTKN